MLKEIHRQRRQRDHLISNDNNCIQLYIYEGIIIAKNQLVMSLSDKGVIFKIDHKTYSPYSFVRKEAIITNDEVSYEINSLNDSNTTLNNTLIIDACDTHESIVLQMMNG
ncbi:hypothetical protein U3516DRAFT_769697 [Neocallimastix sp. 'constans']